MAYCSQTTKANIVAAIKPICKKYGIKATFGVDNHSTFVMNIRSGKLDFLNNYVVSNNTLDRKPKDHMDINQYWFKEQFTGECLEFFTEVFSAIKSAGEWFDKSDIQSDYFHTAFYIDVNVGNWDKPYILLGE